MKWTIRILAGLAVVLIVAQLIPYGRDHENPAVVAEPTWSSPEVRALAKRACFDCHSNETVWPWYSTVAPVSWLVQDDVDDGRRHLNFSTWDQAHPQKRAKKAAQEVEEREMPLDIYVIMHSDAKLTAAERATLAAGLRATFGDAT